MHIRTYENIHSYRPLRGFTNVNVRYEQHVCTVCMRTLHRANNQDYVMKIRLVGGVTSITRIGCTREKI